jgi:hypothetical protein
LLSWRRIARGFKRNVRQDGNVLSLTIPSYPPAGTLARYNNAGGCVAATHPARTISSFFRRACSPPLPRGPARARARAAKTMEFYIRQPAGTGRGVIKNSLPSPPADPSQPPTLSPRPSG